MPRSEAFSKRQEEKKQELLKEHGCYVLKNIKGDITVNNPENYSVEYKNKDNQLRTITPNQMKVVQSTCNIKHEQLMDMMEICKEKDESIITLERELTSGNITLKLSSPIYDKVMKMKTNGTWFQKLLLKLLRL